MAHEAAKPQSEITPEEWRRIREILGNALEVVENERSIYLDQACGNDPILRSRLEELIAAHNATDASGLDSPAFPVTSSNLGQQERHSPEVGRRIGAYRIEAEIARGGMGTVYRAVRADDEYKKRVAIKLVDRGISRHGTGLFRHERQILASLEHPNIARLLDGGTDTDGAPYLVMEYVEGQAITNYCDARRLTVEERLQLFQKVCSAVHFAHQNLIVHRDIKPANILVTADGEPKLLDFGIAKILGGNSAETQTRTFGAMTPAYASPEQLNGHTVTTATDIYSLGLVLYELLTGRYAYEQFLSPVRRQQAILEDDPERPSQAVLRSSTGPEQAATPQQVGALRQVPVEKLSKRLEGDLESILAKAVRKEPEDRYRSVDQLADDVRRHLEGLPVLARKDTVTYRASKFISRHKLGFAAAVMIAATVLAALIVTLREARVARTESALAQQRFTDVRELARSNLFEFNDAIQNLPGSAPARHLVIQRALGYLDKLSRDAGGDPGLMREMAEGYERIASLQGNFSGPGIGDSKAALASYQKALTIRESLTARSNGDPAELKAEANLLANVVQTLMICGRVEEASRAATRELTVAESLLQKQPGNSGAILELARAHTRIASVMGGNGSSASTREIPEAITHAREAIKILAQVTDTNQNAVFQRTIFQATFMLADCLRKNREFHESLKIQDGLLAIVKNLSGIARFTVYNRRAQLLDEMGDFKGAHRADQQALAAAGAMKEAESRDLAAQINFAIAQGSAGLEYARLGHKTAGQKQVDEAVQIGERLLADNPAELFYKSLLLIGYGYQAEIFSLQGDQRAAQAKYEQSLAAATELAQNDSSDLEPRLSMAKLHAALGVVLARARRYPEARQEVDAALTHFGELLRVRPQDADALYYSGNLRQNLAVLTDCLDGRACKVSNMHLPNLYN